MRRTRVLTVGIVVLGTMTAACGAGPSVRPDVAVVQEADGRATPTGEDPALAPELPVPARDLDWRDCTADTLAAQQLPPGPTGLVLECAQLPAAIDATGTVPGSFPLDVLRARLAQTPTDAAPLVMTTGADMPSSGALAALSTGSLAELVASRPIVAVDRRGLGASQPIECIFGADRRALADHGQFGRTGDGPERVAELGRQATIACTDYLQPQELLFDAAHAADDLEQLRTTWGVDRIGVLGIGNGATVALAYASKYPTTLGRLVLDSPRRRDGRRRTAGREPGARRGVGGRRVRPPVRRAGVLAGAGPAGRARGPARPRRDRRSCTALVERPVHRGDVVSGNPPAATRRPGSASCPTLCPPPVRET